MKKIFLLFMVSISITVNAQSDFKELYKSLSENDKFSNLMNLREYQRLNPFHSIPYFLSAEILNEYMRESSPITLFDFIELNYNEIKTFYGLAKFRLDDQQARRDREYYGNIEIITDKRNVTLPDIINEIEKRLTSADEYFSNAKSVHDNFFRFINKYNECLFKYREILKYYPNYKDLCLLTNDNLINDVERMALNFDSSLVFFNLYKASCSKLSNLLKVNEYQLNPIITYRLEGLVESDFSIPLVQLWDFKTWSENYLNTISNDISKIKDGIIETDDLLNKQIDKLKKEEFYDDDLSYFWPDYKFQNLIGKYDYSSITNELFNYKKLKISYLVKTRKEVNNPSDSTFESLINKLIFFKDLAFLEKNLNDEAEKLKKSISIENTGKYLDFFDSHYRGMDGLTRWCEVEKYDNNKIFKANLNHLEKFIQQEKELNNFTDSVILYSNRMIAFGIQNPVADSLLTDTLITTSLNVFKDQYCFLSGIEIDKKYIINSFLTKINNKGKVEWFIKPKFKISGTLEKAVPVFQQLLDDSTCVVLHHISIGSDEKHQTENIFTKTNWKGEVVQTFPLKNIGYPQYFYVDEINEQFLLITKDKQSVNELLSNDTLLISLYDYSGNQLWEKQFLLNGNFIDVVFTNSNLFVTCNFNQFSSTKGEFVSISTDNMHYNNTLGLYINRDGTLKSICQYTLPSSFKVEISRKITSNLINLVGEIQEGQTTEKEHLYLLVDSEGNPVYSSNPMLKFKKNEL